MSDIIIQGARQHNLKNIDVRIPKNQITVITGLSGSGKSTLAFDILYAEGQRRYVESLSTYARQFLGQMAKPDVDQIDGLSPAIAIEQKAAGHNPRSTVGTITEIYDYLRLLFARVGTIHCHQCGRPITPMTVDQIRDRILTLPTDTRMILLAPLVQNQKGRHEKVFARMKNRDSRGCGWTGSFAGLRNIRYWKDRKSTPWKWWWTVLSSDRALKNA